MSAAASPTSIRWKATFVGVLVLIATIFCSAVLHYRAMAALKHEVQDKLLRIALGIAADIDGDLHLTFTDREQENTPAYAAALEPLKRALHWRQNDGVSRNDYRFVYTTRLVGDEVRFVLDPTPPGQLTADGIEEKSHIFQPYPEASEYLLATLRTGRAHADREPYVDRWGTFVSGYAPFFDSAGNLAGAVGVDWYAETYAERLAGIRRAWYAQIVLCLLSGFLSGVGTGVAIARRERAEAARRHALEEAERNRRRWRIMVETLPKPAAHLEDGTLWVNDPLVAALGHPRAELATPEAWFRRLFGPDADAARAAHEHASASGFHEARELTVLHADGRPRQLELTAHAYSPGEVWILEDVTERRLYETRLIEAREAAEAAARAKDTFLATVSHEIRTPMNGVIGMTQLLGETPLDPRQREMVETVRASGETLVVLINDILDYAKIESGGMELEKNPFELRRAVEDSLQLFAGLAAEKGLHLVADIDHACPGVVRGDGTRFRQILCNLISNAVKFTSAGEVVLRVRAQTAATTDQPAPCETLCIDVSDTGPGIPPDRAHLLFRSFSQLDASTARRHGGTGLGLAIARRLAGLMGGTLDLAASSPQGSVFRLMLPLEVEASAPPENLSPRASLGGLRILMVQPHAPTAAVLSAWMRRWGLDCEVAADSAAALRLARETEPFALVLADIQLPGRDGLDLCRDLSALPPERRPRALLVAAHAPEELIAEAHSAGVATVLRKPIRPAALLAALDRALATPEPSPSQPTKPTPSRPLRILVAEDNVINQLVVRRMLERLGYEAEIVADGAAAVVAAAAAPRDLVLMDIQMPGVNGYEATQRIRALAETIRQPWIIALTANALEGDRDTALAHGMDDYLAKPLRLEDLERALARLPLPPP